MRMKKKEWIILGVVVLCAVVCIVCLKIFDTNTSSGSEPETMVDIYHRNEVVQSFDPSVDATYTIEGDYGTLDVVVKDGKWEVDNEQCPNHVCHGMGWIGVGEGLPITCIPNNVIVMERTSD